MTKQRLQRYVEILEYSGLAENIDLRMRRFFEIFNAYREINERYNSVGNADKMNVNLHTGYPK